jgi:hypothetical protein
MITNNGTLLRAEQFLGLLNCIFMLEEKQYMMPGHRVLGVWPDQRLDHGAASV